MPEEVMIVAAIIAVISGIVTKIRALIVTAILLVVCVIVTLVWVGREDIVRDVASDLKDQAKRQVESGEYRETVGNVIEKSGTIFEFFN